MTPPAAAADKPARWIVLFFGALVLCRLGLVVFAPLCDPSESRYAEMSRVMVTSGNWITPQFVAGVGLPEAPRPKGGFVQALAPNPHGVAFWAKPPLSMWASALGMKLFGPNHFGARVFIFMAALGVLALVARAARHEFLSNETGWVAATILMGSPLFFYCSAAVMTDLCLLLGTTLAMVSFRFALETRSRAWGYGFFLGLAIGLLAKGPLTFVLAGPPIFVYMLFTRQWLQLWKRLPWLSGTLLMLLLSVPWYLIAESRTKGFLDYFIVGEHFRRFTAASWAGDLYGSAHSKPIGTIWVYALLAVFPWGLGFLAAPLRRWRGFRSWAMQANGRGLYWLLWALWTPVFFTPARNIISTYPLPALPAMALLLTEIWWRCKRPAPAPRFHPLHPALVSVCAVVVLSTVVLGFTVPRFAPKLTEMELVRCYQARSSPGDHLLYFQKRKFSAEFYTRGAAETTDSPDVLRQRMAAPGRLFLAADRRNFAQLPPSVQAAFSLIGSWGKESALYMRRDDAPPD